MKEHPLIAIIIGTKAELIKCMPLMLELQKRNRDYIFIHTGQHSLQKACQNFGIKNPNIVLSHAPKRGTKFWSKFNHSSFVWFLRMILKIKKTIKKIGPDYVIYHGDTMSTAAAAVGSSYILNRGKTWKNVHLEAGLRSGSLFEPFPEEISRKISDRFSDILLAPSPSSVKNLNSERGHSGRVIANVGNTIVDSTYIAYEMAKRAKFKKPKGEYALVNIHRHENLKSRSRMEKISRIITYTGIRTLWPLHENTGHFLEKYGLMDRIKANPNIEVVPLMDYEHFVFLISNSKYLLTDGGSIQEESLVFEKPCIILRKKTERPEGLTTGINFLTNLNLDRTKKIIFDIENGKLVNKKFKNPYGRQGLSKKILDELERLYKASS